MRRLICAIALLLVAGSANAADTYNWGPDYPPEKRAVHGILCLQDQHYLSPHLQLVTIINHGSKKIRVVGNCAGGDFVFTVLESVEILPSGATDTMFFHVVKVQEVRKLDFRRQFPPSYLKPHIKLPLEAIFFEAEKDKLLEGQTP